MKPRFLIQEAISNAVFLIAFGIAVVAVSVSMLISPEGIKSAALLVVGAAVVIVCAIHVVMNCRYCYLDEKGITFYLRFKPDTFVSWDSITEVKSYAHGHGRGYQRNILIYNDKYYCTPLSPSDINEGDYARGFLVSFANDDKFAEYLSYYRADLKIEE